MPTPRASVNQQVQMAVETIPGTAVPCTKLLTAFTWTMGLKPTTKQFRGTGRQYPSASAILTEMSAGKFSGPGDFAQLVYPLSSLWGGATIAPVANTLAVSTWKWTPPLIGSYAALAKTYTMQVGDTIDAEQYAYTAATGISYSLNRKQEVTVSGDVLAQTFTDGVTLTASPTEVEQAPMTGAQFNVYLDATSAGIGGTQVTTELLKLEYKASDYYDPYWPVNRANASYTSLIDKEKKHELTLTLQADATGIAPKAAYLETGARCYVRVQGTGGLIENDWTVGVGGATAGTFTLTYKGQTTSGIAFNATSAAVQSALRALTTIGATGCSVSGAAPTWIVTFTGALANDTADLLTGSGAGLTGGAFAATAAPQYAAMTHDMACFVANMAEFSDEEGAYAVQYTLHVAEDSAWGASGTAQIMTLTNLLSAL